MFCSLLIKFRQCLRETKRLVTEHGTLISKENKVTSVFTGRTGGNVQSEVHRWYCKISSVVQQTVSEREVSKK